MSQPILWTVGTGHRSLDELLGLLATAQIRRLVDVRSYPKSHLPHFCRDALTASLGDHGLSYEWLGNDLGGLRQGGYLEYMTTERFESGLVRLETLGREMATTVCCAETDPERCHRRFIADALVGRGWQVMHILGQHRLLSHHSMPRQVELPFE